MFNIIKKHFENKKQLKLKKRREERIQRRKAVEANLGVPPEIIRNCQYSAGRHEDTPDFSFCVGDDHVRCSREYFPDTSNYWDKYLIVVNNFKIGGNDLPKYRFYDNLKDYAKEYVFPREQNEKRAKSSKEVEQLKDKYNNCQHEG